MLDLRVRAAQCRCRVRSTQGSPDQGNEQLLIGAFVRKELALQSVQQGMHRGEQDGVSGQGVGS